MKAVRRSDRARRSHRLPAIDPARCTGCGRCVAACDLHLLSLETLRWEKFAALHDPERCTGCSLCAVVCPFNAIRMRAPAAAPTPEGSAEPAARPAADPA